MSPQASELKATCIRHSPCVQDIGDVITKTHRRVAFPNLYQHRVQPFNVENPTKPGHRKIFALFLVDPTQKVPSTTNIAPQQLEWVSEAMRCASQASAFGELPADVNEGAMTRSEAEKYRRELVSERVASVKENDRAYFGAVGPRRWVPCGDSQMP